MLVSVGSLSTIRPLSHPLTLTSSRHWAILGNLCSGLPGTTQFILGFVCSQHTAPRNIKPAQTQTSSSRVTNSHLGRVERRRFISCTKKYTLGQCMIRTRDLSICSRTQYHIRIKYSFLFRSQIYDLYDPEVDKMPST